MVSARCRCLGMLAVAAALSLACGRGPDARVLESDLQRRIDAGFEAGLFRVAAFHRRGSAPFHDLERGMSGLFVYYDAELEFLRAYSLTEWGGLNVGTLAHVVGATPEGVSGFDASGNRPGDRLRIHGRLAWGEGDGEWIPIAFEAPLDEARPVATLEGTGPMSVLEHVRSFVAHRTVTDLDSRGDAVVYELRRALQLIDLRFARMDGATVLGTGQLSGTYAEFGKAFAAFATGRGLRFHAHPSAGSVENAFALQARRLDFGIVQSDVAEALYRGVQRQQLPLPDLRGVASLWPEIVHIVALEGSGVRSLADLRGRRVAIGELGSGTRLNALEIGRAAGLKFADVAAVREVPLLESLAELEAGEVDAVFVTEAVPSRAIQELTQRRDDVRFVPIEVEVLRELSLDHFAYYPARVPARSYPGQAESFRALGLAAALMTHAATPDERVSRTLELLVDGKRELSRVYYRAGFVSSETARLGLALPLHPAAERFYAER